jgi:hypothetical protein
MALLPAVVLIGCGNLGDFNRVKEDFHYSEAFQPGGRLDFDNRNGTVEIAGWDRNSIDVSGTKYAPSHEQLGRVTINVTVNGSNASVSASLPDTFGGNYGAKFLIRVPRQTVLGREKTTNGGVSVEYLTGGGVMMSTNGRVFLARDTGDYEATTTNGSIEYEECEGSMQAHTTNGAIRGRLKSGAIEAHSRNGSIDVTILKPLDGKAFRVSTTNGGITLVLAEFHSNPIEAKTTNGSVRLRVPADTNASVTGDTSLASITNDFTLSGTVDISKHHISGQLGSGGTPISIRTTTGGIHLERY